MEPEYVSTPGLSDFAALSRSHVFCQQPFDVPQDVMRQITASGREDRGNCGHGIALDVAILFAWLVSLSVVFPMRDMCQEAPWSLSHLDALMLNKQTSSWDVSIN